MRRKSVLRHQLNVLRRKAPKRVALGSIDRLVFAGLYRLAGGVLDALKILKPKTVIRWHRAGFRAYWRLKSSARGGRPKLGWIRWSNVSSSQRGYSWRTIMKARFGMALSMVVGAALGGAAIQALHAQSKPPVYMIAINEVSDQERYAKEYVSPAQISVKDHGGEYVAAGPGTQVAGNLPHGPVVILRWESMEALQRWSNSPEFQAALKIGEKYAKFNIVAVNGLK